MQTPYITSPFCWHHTARASRDELRRDSLRGDERSKVTAERIVRLLTDEQMTQIAESLDAGRDLAIHIEPL
ncbi:MAG: hypothetical protein EXQ74_06395 [Thermoleophilia bacterium]|nr:hypothetical protein [Thermoleophilia bacterium]